MLTSSPRRSPRALLLRYTIFAVLLWSGGVFASWWWNYNTHQERLVDLAKKEAATNINKDWGFRLWATSHGGVYVAPDERTPPNPYLTKIPDRDIVTDKGKRLTLMNPAYMMRQFMQDYSDLYGVKGHITSLNLTNPVNKPDGWETEALKSFKQGVKEKVTVSDIDGKPYLRMMRPIRMEQGCMKCHADMGLKVGEIRGGISTAIPMEPLYAAFKPEFRESSLIHFLFWLLGLGAIGLIVWRIRREADEIERYQAAISRLNLDLEQRVTLRTAQLAAANDELEAFAYSISHDLRAPLRAIAGFSKILQMDHGASMDGECKHLLGRVHANVARMSQLIDDILNFSRTGRSALNVERLAMAEMVAEVFQELMAAEPPRSVRLEMKDLPPACGDPSLIRQVLVNLLSNALKYTQHRAQAVIEVGGEVGSAESCYYVKDNGAGFDMSYAAKLFGVFQRLHSDEEFDGTGIGLAIVKRIIDRHGGRVWAEGQVDQGATFHFSLPRQEPCQDETFLG